MTSPYVRPDVAAFLKAMEESGEPPINRLGVEGARAAITAMRDMFDAEPTPLATVRDIAIPAARRTIPARLYDKRTCRGPSPLILFFHGGGFVFGDLYCYEPVCTYLADQIDLPVLAIDYRLAPEHPFPAAPDDAEAAARWAAQGPPELGFTVTGLVTCGDSAGGNLAVVTAKELAKRPAAAPVIAQCVAYPFFACGRDFASFETYSQGFMLTAEAMDWFDQLYGKREDDPRCNCMIGPVPPVPLLVYVAALDPLSDQGRAYAGKARREGVRVELIEAEGMIHNFLNLRWAVPSSAADIDRFIAAMKSLLPEAYAGTGAVSSGSATATASA